MRRIVGCLAAAAIALSACTFDDGLDATVSARSATPDTASPGTTIGDLDPAAIAGNLIPDRCPFEEPLGTAPDCYRLEVPANWTVPGTSVVSVQFAHFPSETQPPAGTVLWVEGGPGIGPLEGVADWYDLAFGAIAATHDIVIYDPRGTGFSRPSLDCPEIDELSRSSVEILLLDEARAADDCAERLSSEGIDLSDYTTVAAARDVEALRKALGIDAWDIWGQSYGTRFAQTYAREFSSNVRSMVLDGAYSIADDPDDDYAVGGPEALAGLAGLCADQPTCAGRYPDLEDRIEALVEAADAEPFEVEYRNPDNGEIEFAYPMSGQDILSVFFGSFYSPYHFSSIPAVVADLESGVTWSLDMLNSSAGFGLTGDDYGAFVAVQCMDEWSFARAELDTEGLFGELQTGSNVYWRSTCGALDLEPSPPVEDQFVELAPPILVLSGLIDPITPHSEATDLAELMDAPIITFPRSGHGQIGISECAASIAARFTLDPSDVDGACAADDQPPMIPGPQRAAAFVPIALEHPTAGTLTVEAPADWTPISMADGPYLYAIRDRHLVDMAGFTVEIYDSASGDVSDRIDAMIGDWFNSSPALFEPDTSFEFASGWDIVAGSTESSPVALGTPAQVTIASRQIGDLIVLVSVFATEDDHEEVTQAILETMLPSVEPLT